MAGDLPADQLAGQELLLLAGAGVDNERFASQKRERHAKQQRFADTQTERSRRLPAWPAGPAERRQRFRLQALTDFDDDIVPALIGADVSPEHLHALGTDALELFLQKVPTLWALTELRRVRFANPRQGFTPHDLYDLRALACALVYCDVVVTDKAWRDAIGRTDLADRYDTIVLNNVADLSVEGSQ